MVSKEQFPDIIDWDVGNWSRILEYWDFFSCRDFNGLKILEIGARNGGLSLWAALKGAEVICSDLNGPSEIAKLHFKKYGIEPKVQCECIDAKKIPYENYFDIILFKSVLGGIGDNKSQKIVFDEIFKSLKSGGCCLFAENLKSTFIHQKIRNKFRPWGKRWNYVTINDILSFTEKFSNVELTTFCFLGIMGNILGMGQTFSKIDKSLDYLLPKNWNSILVGIVYK